MKYWTLLRLFTDHLAVNIILMAVGIFARRVGIITGPLIRNLAFLMLFLIIPMSNLSLFLKADLLEFLSTAPFILPLWTFRLIMAYGFGQLVARLSSMPAYFTKTFTTLLMADSLVGHMFFLRDSICSKAPQDREDLGSTFDLSLPCDPASDKLSFYISFVDALVLFGLSPYFFHSDLLFYKTFGKSLVWIDHQPYLAKFESDIDKDLENYDLLVGSPP